MKQKDPTNLFEMFEGGIKKVAPTMITGILLVIVVMWRWPDASTKPQEFTAADVLLTSVMHLPDGGTETTTDAEGRPGDRVRVAANMPYAGTYKVIWLEGEHGIQLLPTDKDEPERSSAGRLVELGDVTLVGDAGMQTWLLSVCPLGSQPPECVVHGDKPDCPDGCFTATMRAHVTR
jgi:hypothetical protein